MNVVLALGLVAIALGGCAPTLAVSDTPTGAAFPATTPPTVLPPNAFGPEPSHYFGTGGP